MIGPDNPVTELSDGVIYWDGIVHYATLRHDSAQDSYTLTFIDDPLGWGDRTMLSEEGARYLAAAYIHELRAVRSRRH